MSSLLKGNYDLPEGKNPPTNKEAKGDLQQEKTWEEFERRAMERLGGSIAFVMKSKTFMWDGDRRDEAKDR